MNETGQCVAALAASESGNYEIVMKHLNLTLVNEVQQIELLFDIASISWSRMMPRRDEVSFVAFLRKGSGRQASFPQQFM